MIKWYESRLLLILSFAGITIFEEILHENWFLLLKSCQWMFLVSLLLLLFCSSVFTEQWTVKRNESAQSVSCSLWIKNKTNKFLLLFFVLNVMSNLNRCVAIISQPKIIIKCLFLFLYFDTYIWSLGQVVFHFVFSFFFFTLCCVVTLNQNINKMWLTL